jgi:hypothetical protein
LASPKQPVIRYLDVAFRRANGVGVATANDFGVESAPTRAI